MFVIKKEKFGAFEKYLIMQEETGACVSIIPAYGGNVNELVLAKNGKKQSILDGNKTIRKLMQDKSYKGALLIPFSGRIEDGIYRFQDKTYQLPLNNLDKGHALHGFLNDRQFTVINITAGKEHASLELSYVYLGDIPGYPFSFRLGTLYTLTEERFKMEIIVQNTGVEAMPFSCGWHPYFSFDEKVDDLYLHLPAAKSIELNERLIPTGRIISDKRFTGPTKIGPEHLDTTFIITEKDVTTALYSKQKNISIHLWQETGPHKLNYLQVYTPPHRKSIAIEPVTAPGNSFNNGFGLLVLKPGEIFHASYGVYLEVEK